MTSTDDDRAARKGEGSAARAPLDAERCWVAVRSRDPAADESFVYSVRTTGVYCRPSCAGRPARRENVAFHADAAAAERAGFRPCKRCTPNGTPLAERRAAIIAAWCRACGSAASPPTLTDLASDLELAPSTAQRLFVRMTGLSPKAYAAAKRKERLRAELANGQSVTAAIYGAGFGSSGHFYGQADSALGMTPTQYRAGGSGTALTFAVTGCSLGWVLVAASQRGVCAILLGDDPDSLTQELQRRFPRAEWITGDAEFEALLATVVQLIEHPQHEAPLPLDLRGTVFQERVWQALGRIPPGQTLSYAKLADAIGAPGASRAVATACARNPLAVAVPCHRVVRTDGALAGYRWGVERKRALLERERGPE